MSYLYNDNNKGNLMLRQYKIITCIHEFQISGMEKGKIFSEIYIMLNLKEIQYCASEK